MSKMNSLEETIKRPTKKKNAIHLHFPVVTDI